MVAPGVPVALLLRGVAAWVQLSNLIDTSRREFFDHQMRVMAREIGL